MIRRITAWTICLLCIFGFSVKIYAQCFHFADQYICLPSVQNINWTVLNDDIQSSSINWDDIYSGELQSAGFNWDSAIQEVQTGTVNWDSIVNQETNYQAINWTDIPNYSDGKVLTARPSLSGGINWE